MKKTPSPTIHEVISTRLPKQTWLSPDGKWLAHSETQANWEQNTFRQRVIITDLVQKRKAFHIEEETVASQIKWSFDSMSIGFIAIRNGRSVLRVVSCPDGTSVDVDSGTGFTDFDWRPYSLEVVIAEDAEPPRELENGFFSVRGERLPGARLRVVDTRTGETKRFGGWSRTYRISSLSWSPRGDKIIFTSLPEPDEWVQSQHLSMLDLSTGDIVRLIEGERAIFFPVWNEDGSKIAFSERRKCWDGCGGAAIKIMQISDLAERVLIPQAEIHCRIRSWNNGRILISGQLLDRSHDVYAVSEDSGEVVRATAEDMPLRTGVSTSDGSIAYIAWKEDRFPEVTVEREAPSKLTDYHSQAQNWPKMTRRNVVWRTADGWNVGGILNDARSNCKSEKTPLIVLIHGGPESTNAYNAFFEPYFEHWNPYPLRQWNEQGISVFMPDYRGSSGYGLEFRDGISGRHGAFESSDILSGLDHVLAEYGFDSERIGVAGLSYGGYLTMLLAAKYSSRFKAASAFCGWIDARLMLLTSRNNWETDDAWDPNRPLDSQSPLSYVTSDCPPMLLQTGDSDKNVIPAHSLAFHRLLKKRGVTTNLITYKDCGHTIKHPKQLLCAQEHNLDWFTRWL